MFGYQDLLELDIHDVGSTKVSNNFNSLEFHDSKFVEELSKAKELPTNEDWKYVRHFLPFLKLFFYATLKVSGTSYVISNDTVR